MNRRRADRKSRIVQIEDQWIFLTREGREGPFDSAEEAKFALSDYIVNVQLQAPEARSA